MEEGSRWRDYCCHRDRPRGYDGCQQPARLRILHPTEGQLQRFFNDRKAFLDGAGRRLDRDVDVPGARPVEDGYS